MNHESSKKVKRLCALWFISFILTGLLSQIWALHILHETGTFPFVILHGHQLFTLFAVMFYFIPLLFLIRYHAKKALMNKIKNVAMILIIYFTIWSGFMLVMTITEFFVPGTFSY